MSVGRMFDVADFFVYRAALLPLKAFEEWHLGDNNLSVDALTCSEQERLYLYKWLKDPVVREALFLASPDLLDAIESIEKDSTGLKNQKIDKSIYKYFSRMSGRSTPFGLFAGCGVGTVSEKTKIILADRKEYKRHTRPDMDYICQLVEYLLKNDEIIKKLNFEPNKSIYPMCNRVHYCECNIANNKRSYHLVAVDQTEYLDKILSVSARGAEFDKIVESIVSDEIEWNDASEFVMELIKNQILIPVLTPSVTGGEPLDDIIQQLSKIENYLPAGILDRLNFFKNTIDAIDLGGLGSDKYIYMDIAEKLKELPIKIDLNRLFQVDLVLTSDVAVLGKDVVDEVSDALDLLWRMPRRKDDPFQVFKKDFRNRWDQQEIPLVEALDEEHGIGFGSRRAAGDSPLLKGLPVAGRVEEIRQVNWGRWEQWLCQRLIEHWKSGEAILRIEAKDLEPFLLEKERAHPDAFSVMIQLSEKNNIDDSGRDFDVFLSGGSGPSGANLLGRFCHGDPVMQEYVRNFLKKEEIMRPDVIFAEIVHLPEGRIGNVILRPVLRQYEIPFLGRSGVSSENQIPITDLMVSVKGEKVVLRSLKFGKEVQPRMSNAHNYQAKSLGIYRFLCAHQYQEGGGVGWSWGPFENQIHLPRVVLGNVIVSKEKWSIPKSEFLHLTKINQSDLCEQMRKFRDKHGIGRTVLLADGDNKLLFDFENATSLDVFIDLIKDRSMVLLEEVFADSKSSMVRGEEGGYAHEIVIPFLARRESTAVRKTIEPALPAFRSKVPGSEWIFAKIYAGPATVDSLLKEAVCLFIEDIKRKNLIDKWFFIRYADPDNHLRLRVHGEPSVLSSEVIPLLHYWLRSFIDSKKIYRITLDTYEPEYERYGGIDGMELCESIFSADSQWVVDVMTKFGNEFLAANRWKMSLLSADRLMSAFGYDLSDRYRIMKYIRDGFRNEFGVKGALEHAYGKRFREERKEIESLLGNTLVNGFEICNELLVKRNLEIGDSVAKLKEIYANKNYSVDDLLSSLIHMTHNRMLRDGQRPQELAIADFMVRHYESHLARSKRAVAIN